MNFELFVGGCDVLTTFTIANVKTKLDFRFPFNNDKIYDINYLYFQ